MQRCLFFAVYFILVYPLWGQEVTHCSLSMAVEDLAQAQIEARVELTIAVSGDSLVLECGAPLDIKHIHLREGRIKGTLGYQQKENLLYVQLPQNRLRTHAVIAIEYTIDLRHEMLHPFIMQNEELLAINPLAMYQENTGNHVGLFFPAVRGQETLMSLNISHPAALNVATIGSLSFVSTANERKVGSFWDTQEAVDPADFFLVLGDFKKPDPEKLDKKYVFSEGFERASWLLIKKETAPIEAFLSARFNFVFDKEVYQLLDSLKQTKTEHFFIKEEELDDFLPEKYRLYQQSFLLASQGDEEKASQAFTDWVITKKGEDWYQERVKHKWQLSGPKSPRLVKAFAALYRTKNPELKEKERFINEWHADSLPRVRVDYRYQAAKKRFLLLFTQDTAAAALYSVPFRYRLSTGDTAFPWRSAFIKPKVQDTLKIDAQRAPYNVQVSFGYFFPGTVEDRLPDNYLLAQLKEANSVEEKQRVLLRLFTTQNKNLYSTVVGIALRDENSSIRAKGLEAAGQLNAVGALKVKAVLHRLAQEEPEPELRAKAKALVDKYYGG